MSKSFDFVKGSSTSFAIGNESGNHLGLCYAYPEIIDIDKKDLVITNDPTNPKKSCDFNALIEDGLYADSAKPLTKTVVKPYQLNRSDANNIKTKTCCRHLEIAIREVKIHSNESSMASGDKGSSIKITSVALLHKKKTICKSSEPFNRQLYKLLLMDPPDSANLSIQVQAQDGSYSILPLPLPRHNVKNSKIGIDFSISTISGIVHSGTVVCTFSLTLEGHEPSRIDSANFYVRTNDPNDPRNSAFRRRCRAEKKTEDVKHFSLDHPALCFNDNDEVVTRRGKVSSKTIDPKEVENVVIEHSTFTRGNMSFRHWFQTRHPLRPSSSVYSHKIRSSKKETLVITVLRGVEVPVREESALVQPLLEIEWGEIVHSTTPADGPVPIWHQTFHFEVPENKNDQSVKLRLYDQHPVWGLQWLGEASIPMENHRDYKELERWVGLSPLSSPILSFGYVQPSPGHSYTRIYILMKMEQPGNPRSNENASIDALSRAIQRCTIVPYKLEKIENPLDASRLAMLLPSLPLRYGPLTPKQAFALNKVDHFGRAALLASLLRGLGLQSGVILGSSQTRKCSAYVLTIDENMGTILWDPENGDHYGPGDNRCSLIRVYRLINHQNIWENTQQNVTPVSLNYETKSSKDWRAVGRGNDVNDNRLPQILELNNLLNNETEEELVRSIENHLKKNISEWRGADSLTTTWNRHAVTILRGFLSKFNDLGKGQMDKKDLKQLCRAYYTHGFLLNLRHSSLDGLTEQILSTKMHKTFGPVEFAIACQLQKYIGNAHSIWIALVVLRSRE